MAPYDVTVDVVNAALEGTRYGEHVITLGGRVIPIGPEISINMDGIIDFNIELDGC